MMWNRKVFIRIIEVLLCVACVIALRVTDDESRRVFHYLRNRSREWSLLNNVTWGTIGAALATATCGGYLIITVGLLIGAATGELRGRKTEVFLLGLGVILFGIVGSLSLASIENVPRDLVDNAAVFGSLCLLTALFFIADMLMSSPWKMDTQKTGTTFPPKYPAKHRVAPTITAEKETKSPKKEKKPEMKEVKGIVNDGFEKKDTHENSEDFDEPEQDLSLKQHRMQDEGKFTHVEQELREYTQNFENGRLRDSQRFREAEALQQSHPRDSYQSGHRIDDPRIVYKVQDIYQRPVDEVDTPPFPTNGERRNGQFFSKVINPGVRIMKVERDVEDEFDNIRYSDTSQYDNVPVKIKGQSPGILKKPRDVTFSVPPPPKSFQKGQQTGKDEIEMLEECFDSLRTTSTGTQTQPSSATDPGYVKHTASNWPQDRKQKTPGSSPEHTKNH